MDMDTERAAQKARAEGFVRAATAEMKARRRETVDDTPNIPNVEEPQAEPEEKITGIARPNVPGEPEPTGTIKRVSRMSQAVWRDKPCERCDRKAEYAVAWGHRGHGGTDYLCEQCVDRVHHIIAKDAVEDPPTEPPTNCYSCGIDLDENRVIRGTGDDALHYCQFCGHALGGCSSFLFWASPDGELEWMQREPKEGECCQCHGPLLGTYLVVEGPDKSKPPRRFCGSCWWKQERGKILLGMSAADQFQSGIKYVAGKVHAWSKTRGFWPDGTRNQGEALALVHSEVTEVLEALRHGNPPDKAVEGFTSAEVQAGDVIMRMLDLAEGFGWRIGPAILAKMEHNETRPFKNRKMF